MQRIRALTPYQKIVLLILLMMALLFTCLLYTSDAADD